MAKKKKSQVKKAKFKRCVKHVEGQGGPYNPYAVCTVSVLKKGKTKKKKKK